MISVPGKRVTVVMDLSLGVRATFQCDPLQSSGGVSFDWTLHAAAVAELAQCAVPKSDPSFDTAARGTQSSLLRMRRVRDHIFEQLAPLGAMAVAIEFDVPIDVVDEMALAIVVVPGTIERVEKPAEHLRDNVFAAVEEGRQDLFRRAGIGARHRMRNKGLHVPRCTDPRQGDFDRYADEHKRTELLELARIGADVLHAAEVESEVADVGSIGTDIGLLADYDVID
jgi:hypothetical protein